MGQCCSKADENNSRPKLVEANQATTADETTNNAPDNTASAPADTKADTDGGESVAQPVQQPRAADPVPVPVPVAAPQQQQQPQHEEVDEAELRKQLMQELLLQQKQEQQQADNDAADFVFEEKDYKYTGSMTPTRVRTVLIVGETGSGKSTLVNAMANWAAGVGYNDQVRYRLVKEPPQSQAFSQTQTVTTYMVTCDKYSFVLRLIDTPGFGDTSGVERDEQITQNIYDTLQKEDEIHGVCFVAAASLPRLTVTQQYIISKVLTMFGTDAVDNIFLLVTFADGKKAQVLNAIQASGFPYEAERCFHFNNSALFAKGEDRNEYSKNFWSMGAQSLDRFFEQMAHKQPFSLTQTKDVIETQKKLQNYVVSITPQVTIGLSKMDNLKQVLKDIKVNRSMIDENANYHYEETIPKVEKKDKTPGTWNTQCLKCVYDCHHDCEKEDKKLCYVFDDDNEGKCTVCPGSCHSSDHANLDYYFEWGVEVVTREYDTKKLQLGSAKDGLSRSEALKEQVLGEMQGVYDTVHGLMKSIHDAHTKLDQIALRPTNLQFVDYVKLLIEQEKLHKRPGFDGRIEQLHLMLDGAKILKGVVEKDYDPIGDWKQRVEAELKELDATWEGPAGPHSAVVPVEEEKDGEEGTATAPM